MSNDLYNKFPLLLVDASLLNLIGFECTTFFVLLEVIGTKRFTDTDTGI